MRDWLEHTDVLSFPLWDWSIAGATALAVILVFRFFLALLRGRLARATARTHTRVDDALVEVLASTSWLILGTAAVLIGLATMDIRPRLAAGIERVWFLLAAAQAGLWLDRAIRVWTRVHLERRPDLNPVTTTILSLAARGLVWVIVLLSMLANLGVDITAMVASLGIGGVAVALAVQTVLGDLFASFSIGLDKPFEIGDFIVVGKTSGTVEHIGLKTTRIRNISGEQVIWSNTELLKQTIQNFKRMETRRIAFRFGASTHTDPKDIERLVQRVRGVVQEVPEVVLDRVHFLEFGESSLQLEAVYIVKSAEFNVYMDVQQRINLGILRAMRETGVDIAVPVREVHVTRDEAAPPARQARGPRLQAT